MPTIRRPFLAVTLLALTTASALAQQDTAPVPATRPAQPAATPFVRSHDFEDSGAISMQVAVRTFQPANGTGPTITLAPAVHIGDKPFYAALQELLDVKDIVLFEGVLPPGAGRTEFDMDGTSDAARAKRTERRIRLLAIAARMHRNSTSQWPASVEVIVEQADDRLKPYLKGAAMDAWNNPLIYAIQPAAAAQPGSDAPAPEPTVQITSLGADGQPGGEDINRDLLLSDQPPLKSREVPKADSGAKKGRGKGLQQQLAESLGLVFQLDVMSHEGANWRNADLSIDQIQERMAKGGVDGEALFKMLDGSSMQAAFARIILGIVKLMPAAQVMGKLALVEMLSRPDIMDIATGVRGGLDPAAMDVILHDRNRVVIADLRRVLENEPDVKSVAIIYGAAHMPGILEAIHELGYVESQDSPIWLDAITVDPKVAGMSPRDFQSFRKTMAQTLDQQINAAKKRTQPAREP